MSAILRSVLEASPLGFKLAGSRALGCADPAIDWDYVVTGKTNVLGFLYGLGFKEISKSGAYESDVVISVYELKNADETIQVSIEKDAQFKERIIQAMRESDELRDFDKALRGNKDARDALWTALYRLAGWQRKTQCDTCKRAGDDIEF